MPPISGHFKLFKIAYIYYWPQLAIGWLQASPQRCCCLHAMLNCKSILHAQTHVPQFQPTSLSPHQAAYGSDAFAAELGAQPLKAMNYPCKTDGADSALLTSQSRC